MNQRPNLVISTCFQAAWEKLFKYMDIEPRLIQPSVKTFTLDPEKVADAIDERTMGVVCIMGNHYGGHYDPVQAVSDVLIGSMPNKATRLASTSMRLPADSSRRSRTTSRPGTFVSIMFCPFRQAATSMAGQSAVRAGSSGGIATT